MATISEALAIAVQHHQAGRLQSAEQIYRQILQVESNQPDAIHLLGVIAHQEGMHEDAVTYIRHAIALKGDAVPFHNNLGEAYRALSRIVEAVACYRRALGLKPKCLEFHQTQRPVRTASAVQVRQPVFTTSLGRWKYYERALGSLFARLETMR